MKQAVKANAVPAMVYDGGEIDVLWDHHDQAIAWYASFMGWGVKRKESWWPDPRVQAGKMTHLGYGTWLNSVMTTQKLPFHFAERGAVDPNIRWCWRTKDLQKVHTNFMENGIRLTDIYKGPDHKRYFDFWEPLEGTRITAEEDGTLKNKGFRPSCIRIGVKDLKQAARWYTEFVGMVVLEDHTEDDYLVMALHESMTPKEKMYWLLEKLTSDAYSGQIDGPIRPLLLVKSRRAFFAYHDFLRENNITCGDLGGFVEKGRVLFHFYDLDGNRLNVCHC